MKRPSVASAYALAREAFAEQGVDAEAALARLDAVPLSVDPGPGHSGHPGSADALRADADLALAQIPGPKRWCLQAGDLEADRPVAPDELGPEHFQRWVDWAGERRLGLDFSASCSAHAPGEQGLTLGHPDPAVRRAWVVHCQASRAVSAHFGRSLGTPSLLDLRVPDASRGPASDRFGARRRLLEALDEVLAAPVARELSRIAVEGERSGPGGGCHAAGASDFHLACAVRRNVMLGLDAGGLPADVVSQRLSAALPFLDGVLLHLPGVGRDGDRGALPGGEAQAVARELVRGGVLDRVAVTVAFSDASPDRVAAWVIGTRDVRRALLRALLEPAAPLAAAERGLYPGRLALLEEHDALPWAAVWDHYCESRGAPVGASWLDALSAPEPRAAAERAAPVPPRAPATPRAESSAYGGTAPPPVRTEAAERLLRSPEVNALKATVCDMGRRLWQRAYVDGNGGNLSVRVADGLVLCTPTLVSKGFMSPDDLCLVDLDGVQRAGEKRATSEILMHLSIYRVQPLARACVHAHPPHATGFAISGVRPPSCHVPEMEVFCGEVPIAPYFTPGTWEIGEAVARLAVRHNTILMGNHGAVGWGSDVQDAYFKMEILESYCRTVLAANQLGGPNRFTPEQLRGLLAMKQRLGFPDPRLDVAPPQPAADPPDPAGPR